MIWIPTELTDKELRGHMAKALRTKDAGLAEKVMREVRIRERRDFPDDATKRIIQPKLYMWLVRTYPHIAKKRYRRDETSS